MKALVLTRYRRLEWLDVDLPRIEPSEVLIKVSYAGICGSDQHVFNGEFHPRTSLPLIMGHEFAGTIADVGSEVRGFGRGERVTVDPIYWCGRCPACELRHYPACSSLKLLGIDSNGGFAQYVAARSFMLHKIADSIPDRHAALIEVLSIGFHACARAGLQAGDTVAVFGAGRIGQCILQAARTITNQPIFMVDILPARLALVNEHYDDAVVAIDASLQDPVAAIKARTGGRGVDVAYEAVGHAHPVAGQGPPVAQCVQAIRGAGTVCVLGLSDNPVPLVMKDLIWKEATLQTSRVTHGEFARTIDHLSQGTLDPDALITTEVPLEQAQDAFERLETHPADYLKILLAIP